MIVDFSDGISTESKLQEINKKSGKRIKENFINTSIKKIGTCVNGGDFSINKLTRDGKPFIFFIHTSSYS